MALMNKQALLDICKQHKLYRTPALNDKLYCNFKGFVAIDNLQEYTALKALFLEGNALDSIEGLPALPELRCLYLQQNCIWKISHLEGVPELDTLNISHNVIKKIEGLDACPKLTSLMITDNQLEGVDSIAQLVQCQALQTLDMKNNKLTDPAILDVLRQLPNLKCLYLQGNPVVTHMKNYRKLMIAALPALGYLDERPVFEDERRMVNAWSTGGLEAERAERKLIREEKEEYDRRNFEAMQDIRRDGWRRRRERLGLAPGNTDPALDELSDEEYQFEEEPPELVEARKRLAAYTSREGEEEPPELAEARRKLAKEGGALHEGVWQSSPETDAEIYLASVRSSQAEMDTLGRAEGSSPTHSDDGSPVRDVGQARHRAAAGAGGAAGGKPAAAAAAAAPEPERVEYDASPAASSDQSLPAGGAVDVVGSAPAQPLITEVDLNELD